MKKFSFFFSGRSWLEGYLQRNPDVVPRMASSTNKGMSLVTPRAVEQWFNGLTAFCVRNNIEVCLNERGRALNLDETFYGTDGTGGKMTKVKMEIWNNFPFIYMQCYFLYPLLPIFISPFAGPCPTWFALRGQKVGRDQKGGNRLHHGMQQWPYVTPYGHRELPGRARARRPKICQHGRISGGVILPYEGWLDDNGGHDILHEGPPQWAEGLERSTPCPSAHWWVLRPSFIRGAEVHEGEQYIRILSPCKRDEHPSALWRRRLPTHEDVLQTGGPGVANATRL